MIKETAITSPGENGIDRLAWRTRRPPFERTNFRRAALVVNTRSRVGEPAFGLALDRLIAYGIPMDAVYALRDSSRLAETVREARKRLVERNLKRVVGVAKRYRRKGLPFKDLIQEGT